MCAALFATAELSDAAKVWIALTSAAARLLAPAAKGIIVCFFKPVAAVGVVFGGGVALAVLVGGGATGSPLNEKGTVVAPVFAIGGAAVVADETRGARGAGLAGGGVPTVFAPTRRAALSSGKDAVSVATGGGAGFACRRGAAGAAGVVGVASGDGATAAGVVSRVATRR